MKGRRYCLSIALLTAFVALASSCEQRAEEEEHRNDKGGDERDELIDGEDTRFAGSDEASYYCACVSQRTVWGVVATISTALCVIAGWILLFGAGKEKDDLCLTATTRHPTVLETATDNGTGANMRNRSSSPRNSGWWDLALLSNRANDKTPESDAPDHKHEPLPNSSTFTATNTKPCPTLHLTATESLVEHDHDPQPSARYHGWWDCMKADTSCLSPLPAPVQSSPSDNTGVEQQYSPVTSTTTDRPRSNTESCQQHVQQAVARAPLASSPFTPEDGTAATHISNSHAPDQIKPQPTCTAKENMCQNSTAPPLKRILSPTKHSHQD